MITYKGKFIKENIIGKFKKIDKKNENKIVNSIKNAGQYLETGSYIVFRLFNAVSEREEVFIGNVLFNDYISKLLLKTYREDDKYKGKGQIELVFNDLENYYYIIKQEECNEFSLEELEEDFKNCFIDNLEELFLGNEDVEKGIYGKLDNKLLKFYSSNRSVFPFYSIPEKFLNKLLYNIYYEIKNKINNDNVYPTEITANVVVFYSKDGKEKQSSSKFLIERCKDGIISKNELEEALHIEINDIDKSKDGIKNAIINLRKYDFKQQTKYRNLLLKIMGAYNEKKWDLYISELMSKLEPQRYFEEITDCLFINKYKRNLSFKQTCSICGKIISKNIYGKKSNRTNKEVQFGENSSKFINRFSTISPKPNAKGKSKTVCIACLLYSYLKCKLLGTTSEKGNNQAPEKRNLVFFYGQIPEKRINKIQGLLNSLYYSTQKPSIYTYEMINEFVEELERNNLDEYESDVNNLLQELINSDKENQNKRPNKVPPTIWSWYKNGQQSDNVDTHLFSLGQGENKLYTFILPYALNRSDEVQKKFSQNRVAVYSMLSFLSRLTGDKGSFYYLSTPKLTNTNFGENLYYYKDKEKRGSLKEYELLTEVAWKLINERNVSGKTYKDRQNNAFTKRLKLARELENSPVITISKIYRELLSDNRGLNYNNISNIWNKNVASPNLFPLIKISKKIRKEVDFMGQKIDTKELKEFTEKLFSELVLISGVFPKSFSKSPTEFEKYPRLLVKKILKYDLEMGGKDVLAGYREWSTKILHSTKVFYDKDKKKIAEKTEKIRRSVIEHQEILTQKNNLLYLKRSLFGWIIEYLYPLYDLVESINEIINENTLEEIKKARDSDKIKKQKEKFIELGYDFEKYFAISRDLLINNKNYYKSDQNKEDE